ncbi:MAG TPA: TauD/TfdA family dioxygenase [Xanthobacteraceae bacterium]|nr:TauD/TfdA family dioxygenase [Xanthobacteraceae bacterium]
MTQLELETRQASRDWPFEVKSLHPVLGCEISGITLAQAVSPGLFAKVYQAFLDYELILFRDVDLPPQTQVAFARNFGDVQVHVLSDTYGYKGHPEIYLLSNLDRGTAIRAASIRTRVRSTGTPTAPGASALARRQ